MKFFITSDSWWESKVDKIVYAFSDLDIYSIFEKKHYGESLIKISIILMCLEPELNLKQRLRFIKKNKELSFDIMLNLDDFMNAEQTVREKIVGEKLVKEVPEIIRKYKFEDFDVDRFEKDWRQFFLKAGWVPKK